MGCGYYKYGCGNHDKSIQRVLLDIMPAPEEGRFFNTCSSVNRSLYYYHHIRKNNRYMSNTSEKGCIHISGQKNAFNVLLFYQNTNDIYVINGCVSP